MNRAEWMAAVAPLIRPRSAVAAATQLGKMLEFLTDIPDSAFSDASVRAIAPTLKRSPSYAEVRGALQNYVRSLDAPDSNAVTDPSLSGEDRVRVQTWRNHRAVEFKHLDHLPLVRDRMAVALSLQRRMFPAAFNYIIRTDAEAQQIARQRGWLDDEDPSSIDERLQDDWGSITDVQVAYKLIELGKLHRAPGGMGRPRAAALLGMLRMALDKHAPHHSHLLPDHFEQDGQPLTREQQLDALGVPIEQHRAYPLSPEQLDQINPLPNGRKRVPVLAK